jgi:hypothetical protein
MKAMANAPRRGWMGTILSVTSTSSAAARRTPKPTAIRHPGQTRADVSDAIEPAIEGPR